MLNRWNTQLLQSLTAPQLFRVLKQVLLFSDHCYSRRWQRKSKQSLCNAQNPGLFGFSGWQTTASKIFSQHVSSCWMLPKPVEIALTAVYLQQDCQISYDSSWRWIAPLCSSARYLLKRRKSPLQLEIFPTVLHRLLSLFSNPLCPHLLFFLLFWHWHGTCLIVWTVVLKCFTLPPSLPQVCGHILIVFFLQHLESSFLCLPVCLVPYLLNPWIQGIFTHVKMSSLSPRLELVIEKYGREKSIFY